MQRKPIKRVKKNKQKPDNPTIGKEVKVEEFVGDNKKDWHESVKEGTTGGYQLWKEKRRIKITEMYMEGFPQRKIAEALEISVLNVANELREIREEWRKRYSQTLEAIKAEELAKIDHLENVAWAAWQRSCDREETRKERMRYATAVVKGKGDKKKADKKTEENMGKRPIESSLETITRNRDGDVRFLEMISNCIQMRLRITGLLETQGNQGGVTVTINWGEMSNPERKKQIIECDPIEDRIRQVEQQAGVQLGLEHRDSVDQSISVLTEAANEDA